MFVPVVTHEQRIAFETIQRRDVLLLKERLRITGLAHKGGGRIAVGRYQNALLNQGWWWFIGSFSYSKALHSRPRRVPLYSIRL